MGLNNAKDGRLLYHLTELSNLPSILEKGLQSRRALEDARVAFEDVADHQILAGQNENVYLYDYEEGFRLIDWDILMEVGSQAVDAKNIKMAECLTDSAIPAEDFHSIAVSCEENRVMVENIMQESEVNYPPPHINIRPWWFI